MSFDPDAPAEDGAKKFTDRIKELVAKFAGKARSDDERFGAVEEGFTAMSEQFTKHSEQLAKVDKATTDNTTELQKFKTELGELRKLLDTTDANKHSHRPAATGGNGKQTTDC
jgi:chromosome segregation ATPase